MRLSTVVSSLLCFSTAFGAVLHQHVIKRHTSDVCVSLDLGLNLSNHVFGHLDACVCLSTLDIFIDQNPTCKAASKKLGTKRVRDYLLSQINAHRNKKKCTYPPNAIPSPAPKCSSNSDPCGFACSNGYAVNTKRRTCDCPSPKIVYNGKCIDKPGKPGGPKGPQPSGKPRGPQPPQHHQPQPPQHHQPQPPQHHQPQPPQHHQPQPPQHHQPQPPQHHQPQPPQHHQPQPPQHHQPQPQPPRHYQPQPQPPLSHKPQPQPQPQPPHHY